MIPSQSGSAGGVKFFSETMVQVNDRNAAETS